jgi:hypothetical protein
MKSLTQSFTISNWLGMPIELSPRVLALQGYRCVGPQLIKCSECEAEVQFTEGLQFCQDKTQIERACLQAKEAHTTTCIVVKP